MENTTALSPSRGLIKKGMLDILILTFIYFIPAISHLFSFPVYVFDPMRIMVVLSIMYTGRKNAHIIALSLPVFSFIVSGHPVFFKALIIAAELSINVWMFFVLKEKIKNNFGALFLSIVSAKLFYYAVKYSVIALGLAAAEVVATPLYVQLGVALVLSLYIQAGPGKNKEINV